MLDGGQSVVIWGAGKRGIRLLQYLKGSRLDVLAFLDNNQQLQGRNVAGVPVISPEVYLQWNCEAVIIISPMFHREIEIWLKEHNKNKYLLYKDVVLADFDNDAFEADLLAAQTHTSKRTNTWEMQRAVLLNYFQELNWNNLDKYLQKNLRVHYLRGTDVDDLPSRSLELMRRAQKPLGTKMAPSILAATAICGGQDIALVDGVFPMEEKFDLLIMHGLRLTPVSYCLLQEAAWRKIPIIFQEQGFLHSIIPYTMEGVDDRFANTHAVLLQQHNVYINAEVPSYIENVLSSDKEFTVEERNRARRCISLIRQHKLSKYNSQPLDILVPKGYGRKKVLVIDQVYGDKSIEYSLTSDADFALMLRSAIEENPESDIYVKVHPASNKGHYGDVQENSRLHLLSQPANPIALLEQMDKVYTCASTMGFEALMCGCEVHCFGLPFYAGWGLTIDRLSCSRRTRNRSLEEVFFTAYILASTYVSYETRSTCEIEQTIDELVSLRKEYFESASL